jgi:hypothetical protein
MSCYGNTSLTSQLSKSADNRMVPGSNLGQVIFNETRDRGLETSVCSNIANSIYSNIEIESILNTSKKENFELKSKIDIILSTKFKYSIMWTSFPRMLTNSIQNKLT